jgi:type II secretory pathway component PulF
VVLCLALVHRHGHDSLARCRFFQTFTRILAPIFRGRRNFSSILSDFHAQTLAVLAVAVFMPGAYRVFKRWKQHARGEPTGGMRSSSQSCPLIGELAAKISLWARFASTFAQLIHSGVPILESLDIVSVAVGNRYIGRLILQRPDAPSKAGNSCPSELQ